MDERSRRYTALWQENNQLYEQWARRHHLSYNELLILISLMDADDGCTQKDLCGQWLLPKQTVHSILKNMIRKGLVCLEASDGDKRSKKIRFTEEGREAAKQVTDALFDMESRIWDRLGVPSTENLLYALTLFNQFMKEEMTCEKDLF